MHVRSSRRSLHDIFLYSISLFISSFTRLTVACLDLCHFLSREYRTSQEIRVAAWDSKWWDSTEWKPEKCDFLRINERQRVKVWWDEMKDTLYSSDSWKTFTFQSPFSLTRLNELENNLNIWMKEEKNSLTSSELFSQLHQQQITHNFLFFFFSLFFPSPEKNIFQHHPKQLKLLTVLKRRISLRLGWMSWKNNLSFFVKIQRK